LTFGPEPAADPVWSPDGREVLYGDGTGLIFRKAADGGGEAVPVLSTRGHPIWTRDWSPDGSSVSLNSQSSKTGNDIEILPLPGGHEPRRFLASEGDDRGGIFSPDGKWLAYTSNESGRPEAYVVPFPGPGGKRQISAGGCLIDFTLWINGGRELVYATPERKLNAVELTAQGTNLIVGRERALFGGRASPGLGDFTRDGRKMLLPVPVGEDAAGGLTLVTDWSVDLNKP
jgi:Tol biopolymer transport system component